MIVTLDFQHYLIFQKHYYQPMFTLIGGGMKTLDDSCRPTKDVLSPLVSWVKDKADQIDPKNNKVVTKSGDIIEYE
jgi:eukaryotic sulfide quinone oxidoreductase